MMIRSFFGFLLLSFHLASLASAQTYTPKGSTSFILDQTSGLILHEHNADVALPPASMSKLMTLNMLFEAIDDGRVTLETEFRVSQKAHNMGGSKMFVREGTNVSVEDLIRGIVVQSGNDACIVVAENLAGDEDTFAVLMTKRAAELGLKNSTFGNSTGWPHPKQRMSARDLALLAERLITKFPQYYPYFAEEEFEWEKINQRNRNPLLGLGIGADGLKTGHTEEAGYGLVASAKQGKRRIIFVVSGLANKQERAKEAERITNWAFRQFIEKTLVKKQTQIAELPVWVGRKDTISVGVEEDLARLVPAALKIQPKMTINLEGPIPAPIKEGQEIATLTIDIEGMAQSTHKLIALETVASGGLLARLRYSTLKLKDTFLPSTQQ